MPNSLPFTYLDSADTTDILDCHWDLLAIEVIPCRAYRDLELSSSYHFLVSLLELRQPGDVNLLYLPVAQPLDMT